MTGDQAAADSFRAAAAAAAASRHSLMTSHIDNVTDVRYNESQAVARVPLITFGHFSVFVRGATTFSKFGGPIPWSRLLYRTKYG